MRAVLITRQFYLFEGCSRAEARCPGPFPAAPCTAARSLTSSFSSSTRLPSGHKHQGSRHPDSIEIAYSRIDHSLNLNSRGFGLSAHQACVLVRMCMAGFTGVGAHSGPALVRLTSLLHGDIFVCIWNEANVTCWVSLAFTVASYGPPPWWL